MTTPRLKRAECLGVSVRFERRQAPKTTTPHLLSNVRRCGFTHGQAVHEMLQGLVAFSVFHCAHCGGVEAAVDVGDFAADA